MKDYKNTLKYLVAFAGLSIITFIASCKKYEEIGSPPNQLTADKIYADSASIISAVLNLYSNFNINGNGAFIVNANEYGSMSADDAYYLPGQDGFDQAKNNTMDNSGYSYPSYSDNYSGIYIANSILQGLSSTKAISVTLNNQLTGEAKFWRAYLYFYLVNNFGGVPLVINNDALTAAKLPNATVAEVYQQMIKDLTEAKSLLTDAYPSDERVRINKKAVSAFLARVYLYQQNWTGAEAEANEVINSNTYSLEPVLANVFISTSKEVIWQVQSNSAITQGVTLTGRAFLPAGASPNFVLYQALVNAFEPNDQRKTNWAHPIIFGSNTYYYPYKYKLRNRNQAGNEYSVMLRLAETYLIRGEARLQQGDISGAQADINQIRRRAGLANTAANDKTSLLLAVEQERWVELFTENSDRWFNLKRTARINDLLPVTKAIDISNYKWNSYQALYPFPKQELLVNPSLKQNPGY